MERQPRDARHPLEVDVAAAKVDEAVLKKTRIR